MYWKDFALTIRDKICTLWKAHGRTAGGLSITDTATPTPGHILVFAAHPDDETIGCGMTLFRLGRAGYTIDIVFTTDGRGYGWWCNRPSAVRQIIATRMTEAMAALSVLKVPKERIHFLGYPDAGLHRNMNQALRDIGPMIQRANPRFILVHGFEGGHVDHDVTSLLVQLAAAQSRQDIPVIEWAEYSRTYHLGDSHPVVFPAFCECLNPSYAAADTTWQSTKQQALRQYASQSEPQWAMWQLERFRLAHLIDTPTLVDHFYPPHSPEGARYGPVLHRFANRASHSHDSFRGLTDPSRSWLIPMLGLATDKADVPSFPRAP